jgi:hypothetical protein
MNRRRGWLGVWALWPFVALAQTAPAPPAACPPPEGGASVIEQGGVTASWAAEPALAVSKAMLNKYPFSANEVRMSLISLGRELGIWTYSALP